METENENPNGEGQATGEEEQESTLTPEEIANLQEKGRAYDALLPEFTRRSQKLSDLEGKGNEPKPEEKLPAYHDPNWKPKDYNDLRTAIVQAEEAGETRALKKLEAKESVMKEAQQQLDNFVSGAKSKDKTFDEDAFYKYAAKHKFPLDTIDDLHAVLSAYNESPSPKKGTKEGDERINSGGSHGSGSGPDFTDLRVRGGDIHDVAHEAYSRTKR